MFSCSQCSFKANYESALMMHRQLYHEAAPGPVIDVIGGPKIVARAAAPKLTRSPREGSPTSIYSKKIKGLKLGSRTSSATRIFGKLRAKICRSKVLYTHQENPSGLMLNSDFSCRSECTSKAMQMESPSRTSATREPMKETYACHLCSFDADRITVLDRHLLNDHKIGLDNLLKLVLAKTTDGLAEDSPPDLFGTRQPYYKTNDSLEDTLDEGEFMIETTTPKIKILKHAATNTDLTWSEIPDLRDNCQMITKELDRLTQYPARMENNTLLEKMQTLNEYMCKFVDSSNTLKKVLSRDVSGKHSARRETLDSDEPFFDLRLAEQDTPRTTRKWERAHSEKIERYKSKHSAKYRSDKTKLSSESYYF